MRIDHTQGCGGARGLGVNQLPDSALARLSRQSGVSVYGIDLQPLLGEVDRLVDTLDDDEKSRAQQLRLPEVRGQFIARRWWRKQVLASHLAIEANTIRIAHDHLGKPTIIAPDGAHTWGFSTSHSRGQAVMVIAEHRPIGIDIACPDVRMTEFDTERHFMSPSELDEHQRLPRSRRIENFFRIWTRKEAVLKALGTGLSLDPRLFDVHSDAVTISPAVLRNPASPRFHVWTSLTEVGHLISLAAGMNT